MSDKISLSHATEKLVFADTLISWGVNGDLVNILIGTPDRGSNSLNPDDRKLLVTADLRLPIALFLEIGSKVGQMINEARDAAQSSPPPQGTILN